MRISKTNCIVQDGKVIAGPFETNREAWRALDKLNNEAVGAKESRHDWYIDKTLKAEE